MNETHFHSEKRFRQALHTRAERLKRTIKSIRLILERVVGKGYYIYFGFELGDYTVQFLSRRWFPLDESVIAQYRDLAHDMTLKYRINEGPFITERGTHPDCDEDYAPQDDLDAKLYRRIVDVQGDLVSRELGEVSLIERRPERTIGGCEIILSYRSQHGHPLSVKIFNGYPWSEKMVEECIQWTRKVASDYHVPVNFKGESF